MEETLSIRDAQGVRTAAILSTPSAPTTALAILCHGFLSNKNSTTNKALTRLLLEHGIATLRFDFFGQGDSDGPFEAITVTTAITQTEAVVTEAGSRGFTEIGLVGSSFGGLIALLTAARHPRLCCLALKCPVPDFPELLRLEFGPEGMAEWQRTHTIPDVTGKPGRLPLRFAFYEDCLRHQGYVAAASVACPTLIVQGDRDELVPLHQSRQLQQALAGPSRVEIVAGADHGFTKGEHFHRMTELITEWLTRHLVGPAGSPR